MHRVKPWTNYCVRLGSLGCWLLGLFCFAVISLDKSTAFAVSRNFSQYPGFAEWYAKNPPSNELPSEADQALLRRHRPRFFFGKEQTRFIDFYRDYIANGTLRDGAGKVLSEAVTPEVLNRVILP